MKTEKLIFDLTGVPEDSECSCAQGKGRVHWHNHAEPNTHHTPGPWIAPKQRKDYLEYCALKKENPNPWDGYFRSNDGDWSVVGADHNPVAKVTFKGTAKRGQGYIAPDPEGLANAHLIAAAPDLLEALKELNSQIQVLRDELHHRGVRLPNERVNMVSVALKHSHEAIAKAEGK